MFSSSNKSSNSVDNLRDVNLTKQSFSSILKRKTHKNKKNKSTKKGCNKYFGRTLEKIPESDRFDGIGGLPLCPRGNA